MKYHEVDKEVTRKVYQEMLEDGMTSYPVRCPLCEGKGEECSECLGTGVIEYETMFRING